MMHPRCWVHSSIDTHAPLILYSNRRLLVSNLLSLHLVRISPRQSVYLAKQVWKVARRSSNIYMACMGWLENLYEHILFLESCILYSIGCILISKQSPSSSLPLSPRSLYKTCHVHQNTPNPAMDGMSDAERISSGKLLNRDWWMKSNVSTPSWPHTRTATKECYGSFVN